MVMKTVVTLVMRRTHFVLRVHFNFFVQITDVLIRIEFVMEEITAEIIATRTKFVSVSGIMFFIQINFNLRTTLLLLLLLFGYAYDI